MRNSKILTKIITTLVLSTLLLMVNIGNAKAALQANQNTQYTKLDIPTNWMSNFRKMEQAGEAMGLSESLNENLTPESSNNIDVHMMRSTEYGAIAILSASGYGNPSNDKAIETTTGNNTGVMLNISNWENVAGVLNDTFASFDSRYYDSYGTDESAKVGDALGATGAGVTNPGCRRMAYSGLL